MKKPLLSVLLSAAFLLTAGAARGWAGTITFNNSSIQPDAALTTTLPEGMATEPDLLPMLGISVSDCQGDSDGFGCVNNQNSQGENSNQGATGYAPTGFAPDLGFSPASFDTTTEPDGPPATLGLSPASTDDGAPGLVFQFAGFSAPAGAPVAPDTNLDESIVTQDVNLAAVPESGTLILVGLGFVAGAKYLRRRRLA